LLIYLMEKPSLLTTVEEQNLLERLKQGEEVVRGTLIERNLRLVVYNGPQCQDTIFEVLSDSGILLSGFIALGL